MFTNKEFLNEKTNNKFVNWLSSSIITFQFFDKFYWTNKIKMMMLSSSIFITSLVLSTSWSKSSWHDFIIILLKSIKSKNNFIWHVFSIISSSLNEFVYRFDYFALSSLYTSTSKLRTRSCSEMIIHSLRILSTFVIYHSNSRKKWFLVRNHLNTQFDWSKSFSHSRVISY